MIELREKAQNAACNGVVRCLDGGGGPGKLKILDGAGRVLCEIRLARPAFDPAVGGTAAAARLPVSGVGTALAGPGAMAVSYVATDAHDNVAWSGEIPRNMTLDNPNIVEGQVVSIMQWTHSQPAR